MYPKYNLEMHYLINQILRLTRTRREQDDDNEHVMRTKQNVGSVHYAQVYSNFKDFQIS